MRDAHADGRRIKRRAAARVVVVAGDHVLLQGDRDPFIPGSRFWQTPGGGVDPGESTRTAAARELAEETGLAVDDAEFIGPVATRLLIRGYSDRILIQDETFYVLHTDRFDPVADGQTESEVFRGIESAWFPLDALPPVTWPPQVAEMAAWDGGAPMDLGEVEESTVPVSALGDGAADEQHREDDGRERPHGGGLPEGAQE